MMLFAWVADNLDQDTTVAGLGMPNWVLWILAISIVAGAMHTIWTRIIKPISKGFKVIHKTYEQVMEYDERLEHVETHTKELARNSGTSLRDAVDRIEVRQAHDGNVLAEHLEWSQSELLKVWQNLASRDAVEAAAKTAELIDTQD